MAEAPAFIPVECDIFVPLGPPTDVPGGGDVTTTVPPTLPPHKPPPWKPPGGGDKDPPIIDPGGGSSARPASAIALPGWGQPYCNHCYGCCCQNGEILGQKHHHECSGTGTGPGGGMTFFEDLHCDAVPKYPDGSPKPPCGPKQKKPATTGAGKSFCCCTEQGLFGPITKAECDYNGGISYPYTGTGQFYACDDPVLIEECEKEFDDGVPPSTPPTIGTGPGAISPGPTTGGGAGISRTGGGAGYPGGGGGGPPVINCCRRPNTPVAICGPMAPNACEKLGGNPVEDCDKDCPKEDGSPPTISGGATIGPDAPEPSGVTTQHNKPCCANEHQTPGCELMTGPECKHVGGISLDVGQTCADCPKFDDVACCKKTVVKVMKWDWETQTMNEVDVETCTCEDLPPEECTDAGGVPFYTKKCAECTDCPGCPTADPPPDNCIQGGTEDPTGGDTLLGTYCSPLRIQVVTVSGGNTFDYGEGYGGTDELSQTTLYKCSPVDKYFNPDIHDTCVGSECKSKYITAPPEYLPEHNYGVLPGRANALQWNTIPDEKIVAVLGTKLTPRPSKGLISIGAAQFSDTPYSAFFEFSQTYAHHTTETGVKVFMTKAPSEGGTVFMVEENSEEGIECVAIIGAAHMIYFTDGDRFNPTNEKPHGKIMYGDGTIYYGDAGGFNLGDFDGLIKTENGRLFFSKPSYRYTKGGVQSLIFPSEGERLDTLRYYDPLFLQPSLGNNMSNTPRNPAFQNKSFTYIPGGDGEDIERVHLDNIRSASFVQSSIRLLDPRFSFELPSARTFSYINNEFLSYKNTDKTSRHVFRKNIHRGLAAILEVLRDNRNDYRPEFLYDIDRDQVRKSLRGDLQDAFIQLTDEDDVPIPTSILLDGIYDSIISNNLSEYDPTYFKKYIANNTKVTTILQGTKLVDFKKNPAAGYRVERGGGTLAAHTTTMWGEEPKSRLPIFAPNSNLYAGADPRISSDAHISGDLTYLSDLVRFALFNRKSLDFREYGIVDNKESQEKMKKWWILPQDIRLNLNIIFPNNNEGHLYINNDKSLQFINEEGKNIKTKIDNNYQTVYHDSAGNKTFTLELNYDQIQYTFTMERNRQRQLFDFLNLKHMMEMTVETSNSMLEFTPDLSSPLESVYYLKINTDSIEDIPTSSNVSYDFIQRTDIVYDVCSYDDVKELARDYPWPNTTLHINYNDPIISLLLQEGKAKFSFYDFTLDFVGYPNVRFPRRIPPFIPLVPTNKTKYIPYGGFSVLQSLNNSEGKLVRQLGLTSHFDSSLTSKKLDVPKMFTKVYPRISPLSSNELYGITQTSFDITDFVYTLKSSGAFKESEYYINKEQPAERTSSPIKKAFDIITTLNNQFILAEGLTEYDVWSRLGALAFYGLQTSNLRGEPTVNQLFSGSSKAMGRAATGVRVFKNISAKNLPFSGDSLYFNRTRIIKEKTNPPPLTPLQETYLKEVYINPAEGSLGPKTKAGTPGTPGSPQAPDDDKPNRSSWR